MSSGEPTLTKSRTFRNARRAAEWLSSQGFLTEDTLGIIVRIGKGKLARAFTTVNARGRVHVEIVEVPDEGVSPHLLGHTRKPTGDTADDSKP